MTGIKALDKLLQDFGFRDAEGKDAFQWVIHFQGKDERLATSKMPFCFYRFLNAMPETQLYRLHSFYLPYKKQRLAAFLIDNEGHIVEKVFYQRDRAYVDACHRLAAKLHTFYQQHSQAA